MLNSLLFCSLGWHLVGTKTRNGPIEFHNSSIFKLKILQNYRLEFFWKNLRRNYLVKLRFPLESDLVYVQSIFFAPLWRRISLYGSVSCFPFVDERTKFKPLLTLDISIETTINKRTPNQAKNEGRIRLQDFSLTKFVQDVLISDDFLPFQLIKFPRRPTSNLSLQHGELSNTHSSFFCQQA